MFEKHVLSAVSYSREKLCVLSTALFCPSHPCCTPGPAAQDLTAQFWQNWKEIYFYNTLLGGFGGCSGVGGFKEPSTISASI